MAIDESTAQTRQPRKDAQYGLDELVVQMVKTLPKEAYSNLYVKVQGRRPWWVEISAQMPTGPTPGVMLARGLMNETGLIENLSIPPNAPYQLATATLDAIMAMDAI